MHFYSDPNISWTQIHENKNAISEKISNHCGKHVIGAVGNMYFVFSMSTTSKNVRGCFHSPGIYYTLNQGQWNLGAGGTLAYRGRAM